MKILLVNKYLYPKGGAEISTINTGKLLEKKGHEVYFWGMKHPDNFIYSYSDLFVDYIDYNVNINLFKKLKLAFNLLYSLESKAKFEAFINLVNPDIVHLNNIYHHLSPSIIDVLKKYDIPAIMTMHDYKMVCPSYLLLSKGKVCEKCKNGKFYHCLLNKCTKNSLFKSFLNTVEMYLHHNILKIYDYISCYISPSRFLLNKIKEMGLKGKVVYLPNFVNIENFNPQYEWEEESILYVGRLSEEKGVTTLIKAVKNINLNLKIIGDGPLKKYLIDKVKSENLKNVKFLGYMKQENLFNLVKSCMFTVIPSECYENNPRSVIESFALGKPVIGARIGGIPELVKDWETGLTFESGNIDDLWEKIIIMLDNKDKIPQMGYNARKLVEKDFNPEKHYEKLIKIYEQVI